jgi:hypothetical protein
LRPFSGRRFDRHVLGDRARFEAHVLAAHVGDVEDDAGADGGFEAAERDLDGVGADRQLREGIESGRVGLRLAGKAGLLTLGGDRGRRHDGPGRIRHGAANAGGRYLTPRARAARDHQHRQDGHEHEYRGNRLLAHERRLRLS